jgi:ATP-dependent Clp protease protease subunit
MDESYPKNLVDCEIFEELSRERVLFLQGDITSSSATELVANLLLLDKQSINDEIVIYISSQGGDVGGLMAIYDTFQSIQAPIRTVCIGEACSAAAIILTAGSKGLRSAYKNSRIMIHDIQLFDLSGSHAEVAKESKRIKKDSTAIMEIIARHSGQSLRKIKRDCKTDKYFTASEALSYGIIDEIVKYKKEIPELRKG